VLLSITGYKPFVNTVEISVINFHENTSFPNRLPDTRRKPELACNFLTSIL
jgi:hypothetical protein